MDEPLPDAVEPEKRQPVFVAFKLSEARAAEAVFTEHEIDFIVEVEVLGRTLLGLPRNGALFSVWPDALERSVWLLERAGLGLGIIPKDTSAD